MSSEKAKPADYGPISGQETGQNKSESIVRGLSPELSVSEISDMLCSSTLSESQKDELTEMLLKKMEILTPYFEKMILEFNEKYRQYGGTLEDFIRTGDFRSWNSYREFNLTDEMLLALGISSKGAERDFYKDPDFRALFLTCCENRQNSEHSDNN